MAGTNSSASNTVISASPCVNDVRSKACEASIRGRMTPRNSTRNTRCAPLKMTVTSATSPGAGPRGPAAGGVTRARQSAMATTSRRPVITFSAQYSARPVATGQSTTYTPTSETALTRRE
jgi:hypothetical protein